MWDVTTRTEIARLGGHSGWVNDVAFAPDGRTAFSASDDATLASWDVATGEPLKRFTGDPTGLRAVAISADGTTALSGSNGGSLTLWNLATGEPIRTIAGHDGAITRAIFGPVGVAGAAGSTAITASADSSIVLWDLETGKRIRTFAGHSGWVTDVAAHPDGTRIMSTGEDLSLRMWDIESGQQTHEQLFGFDLGSIAITPDGRPVAEPTGNHLLHYLSGAQLHFVTPEQYGERDQRARHDRGRLVQVFLRVHVHALLAVEHEEHEPE